MRSHLVAVVCAAMLVGCSKTEKPSSDEKKKEPDKEPAVKTKPAKSKYPYPECEVILKDIRENTGDPKSIEIIKWGGRQVTEEKPPRTIITIKLRKKNDQGAMVVKEYWAYLYGMKLIGIEDADKFRNQDYQPFIP